MENWKRLPCSSGSCIRKEKRNSPCWNRPREFPDFSQSRGRARVSHARGGASDTKKNEGLPVVCWLDTLSSAEAPYGKFLNNVGRAGNDGKRERAGASLLSFPFPAFPARCRFSLSPGPRPAATTARKKWTKEASAEERVLELLLAAILNKWKIGLTRPLYYYFALFKIQNPRRFASGIPSFSRLVMSLATRPNKIPPWLYTVPYSL